MAAAGPFRVVLAEPPWKFGDALPGRGRGAAKHYRLLSVAELCAFPLPLLTDDYALFLWRVAAMQQDALDVMAAWSFTLKTEIVWNKLTVTRKQWFGMGRIVRAAHEVRLVGTRGRPVPRSHSVRSTFDATVGRHSEKPDVFYDLAEALFEGRYVELFARRQRGAWTSLGDEVEPVRLDDSSSNDLETDNGARSQMPPAPRIEMGIRSDGRIVRQYPTPRKTMSLMPVDR